MIFKYLTLPLSLLVASSLIAGCSPANDTSVVTPVDAGAATPVADVKDDATSRVAQLSLADGTVTLRPTEDEEWATADVNQAVFEGTELYAEDGSTGEVVLGDNRYVRFADGADVEFTQLEPEQVQLDVTAGTVTLALDELESTEHYEVNTPGGAIIPSTGGEYRIDVDENGDTWLTVRRGTAKVMTQNGTFDVNEGDRVNLNSDDPSSVEVARYDNDGSPDDWDNFNDQRRVYYTSQASYDHPQPVSDLYGRSDIFGLAALAGAGIWQLIDNDRYVWQPRVASNWSPYENGYWDYSPRAGYTWVSNDQWGWAPYHYGRWDHNDNLGWYWSPSDGITTAGYSTWRTNRYQWQPALVYTFQPQNSTNVAWVPLAYGEPYVAYSSPWRSNVTVQDVAFQPRFYRERRGVVYVTDDGFKRRQKARRADPAFLRQVEQVDVAQVRPYKLPKPDRIVAVDRVAKVRPPEKVRQRTVVVAPDTVGSNRVSRRAAKAGRPVVKADGGKQLEARRPAANVAREKPAPRVTRQGGKMRAERGVNRTTEPRARAVKPTAPTKPNAAPAPAPRQRAQQQPRAQKQPKAQQQPRAQKQPKARPNGKPNRP